MLFNRESLWNPVYILSEDSCMHTIVEIHFHRFWLSFKKVHELTMYSCLATQYKSIERQRSHQGIHSVSDMVEVMTASSSILFDIDKSAVSLRNPVFLASHITCFSLTYVTT